MIQVPFSMLEQRHVRGLAEALIAAPAEERDSPQELISRIRAGASILYEFDGGLVLISQRDRVLLLDALYCSRDLKGLAASAQMFTEFADNLREIAAERKCDKIKTNVFDPRLASVIEHLGGYVESRVMTLGVEHSDG